MSRILLLAAAGLTITTLVACNSGLDSDDSGLPQPAIFAAEAPEPCAAAGSTTISLDPASLLVIENAPQTSALGAQQLELTGVISGMSAGDVAYGVVLGGSTACPLVSARALAPTGDGTFTERLRISFGSGLVASDFRVVVMTGPAGATFDCPTDEDCLRMTVGGTATSPTGVSNAIGVRL